MIPVRSLWPITNCPIVLSSVESISKSVEFSSKYLTKSLIGRYLWNGFHKRKILPNFILSCAMCTMCMLLVISMQNENVGVSSLEGHPVASVEQEQYRDWMWHLSKCSHRENYSFSHSDPAEYNNVFLEKIALADSSTIHNSLHLWAITRIWTKDILTATISEWKKLKSRLSWT